MRLTAFSRPTRSSFLKHGHFVTLLFSLNSHVFNVSLHLLPTLVKIVTTVMCMKMSLTDAISRKIKSNQNDILSVIFQNEEVHVLIKFLPKFPALCLTVILFAISMCTSIPVHRSCGCIALATIIVSEVPQSKDRN